MLASTTAGIVLATVGGVALVLYLVRRKVAGKWGYFTSTRLLRGQVAIITGGNIGLGAETAKDLAARGATVILACRSWERTKDVLATIRQKSGNNDVQFMKLDLASMDSVKEFAEEFKQKYSRLDTLVLNAGVWFPKDKNTAKTEDGFEMHAGVNHLGHFLLTDLLLDTLKKTDYSRVVTVSSSLMRSGRLDFENLNQFYEEREPADEKKRGFAPIGYCDSKLMNALFTKELAKRNPGLSVTCVCPGWCYTQLARNVTFPFYKKVLFAPIAFMFMRSAARGAHNIIHAAVEHTDNLVPGGFYRECKLSVEDNDRLDGMAEDAAKLWQLSEQHCHLAETN